MTTDEKELTVSSNVDYISNNYDSNEDTFFVKNRFLYNLDCEIVVHIDNETITDVYNTPSIITLTTSDGHLYQYYKYDNKLINFGKHLTV